MSKNPNASRSHWRAPDGNQYPIFDIPHKYGVRIPPPTPKDIKDAIPVDPHNCALANTWKRIEHVNVAQFGIDKVYMPMRVTDGLREQFGKQLRKYKNGEIIALRGKNPQATRKAIDNFDRTGEIPPEGFWIKGIPPSEGIESQRAKKKRLRERWATLGAPAQHPRRKITMRNASRKAQVFRDGKDT